MERWRILMVLMLLAAVCGKAEIRRTEHGVFQVEKQKFGVAYWSLDWKVSAGQVLNPESVSFPGEGGDETPQGIRRQIADDHAFPLAHKGQGFHR